MSDLKDPIWLYCIWKGLLSAVTIYVGFRGYKLISFLYYESYLLSSPVLPKNDLTDHVISDFRECVNGVIKILNRKPLTYRVAGMDCEMTSTSVNGGHPVPAIVQLANPDGFCAIFQLKVMERSRKESADSVFLKFLPYGVDTLSQVLEDPNILKVGVGILDDAKYLDESYGLMSKGCLDIRHLAEKVGVEPKGLDYLASTVLGRNKILIKHKKPWEKKILSKVQIAYAAQDARLSVDVFMKLNEIAISKQYSWPRRLFWNEKTYWQHTLKLWEKFIGQNFKLKKEETPSYDNWIQDLPFMRHIGYFPWRYFVPESTTPYLQCVVCESLGDPDSPLIQKAIVPVDYKIECLENLSHYLYLCKSCFEKWQKINYELREELTEMCGAPYPDYEDHRLINAKTWAKELLDSCAYSERMQLQEYKLCEVLSLSRNNLNRQTMEFIKYMDCWPGSAHGEHVRHYYERFDPRGKEGLRYFWCQQFLLKMNPRNISDTWI